MAKVYKREGPRGVSWVADWLTPEGKRLRKFFELKKDADDHVAKVRVAKRENRYHDVFDVKKETLVTFNELADEYVKNFGGQRSFEGFKRHVVKDLREVFGDKRLSEIIYLELETYRNRRKDTPTKAGKPRTDASVNRDMAILGHMLSKAVEWGMRETSPFKKGKRLMFKENNQRLRFLTDVEVEALMKACSPHLRPIVEVALLTGMRRGELLGLKWEQIRNGFIYLTETKSNKARQIPINDRLAEVFKEVRREKQLKSPYVFCDSKGRRFFEVKRSFASACRRAGLEDFRFHDLRHTFASHLVMNGVGLKAVQELLGHADIKMTMRYAHLSQAHLKEAVAVLNKLGIDTKLTQNPRQNKKADSLTSANLL
jgi:integrase